MSELYVVYSEYLERMLSESDDLTCVAEETVPEDINWPAFEEWAYVA